MINQMLDHTVIDWRMQHSVFFYDGTSKDRDLPPGQLYRRLRERLGDRLDEILMGAQASPEERWVILKGGRDGSAQVDDQ
jgi:hypothetical protein